MKNPSILSIVICTRNRSYILPDCLDSLLNQSLPSSHFEVLLIDNASTDETPAIAHSFAEKFEHYHYCREPNIGLSYARNCGYQQAKGEWVIYLDDDARTPQDFVERAFWITEHFDFDLFGGMYYAWFKFGSRRWLPTTFGTKEKLLDKVDYLKEGFASGGIMAVKKEVLKKIGGFNPKVGMKKGLGYGEEDELQMRMRSAGYRIGFDPEWRIDHCVLPDKLKLNWHFKAAYAHGRDQALVLDRYSFFFIFYASVRSVIGILWKTPGALFDWLTKSNFYWENIMLRLFIPVAVQIGRLRGWFIRYFGI